MIGRPLYGCAIQSESAVASCSWRRQIRFGCTTWRPLRPCATSSCSTPRATCVGRRVRLDAGSRRPERRARREAANDGRLDDAVLETPRSVAPLRLRTTSRSDAKKKNSQGDRKTGSHGNSLPGAASRITSLIPPAGRVHRKTGRHGGLGAQTRPAFKSRMSRYVDGRQHGAHRTPRLLLGLVTSAIQWLRHRHGHRVSEAERQGGQGFLLSPSVSIPSKKADGRTRSVALWRAEMSAL